MSSDFRGSTDIAGAATAGPNRPELHTSCVNCGRCCWCVLTRIRTGSVGQGPRITGRETCRDFARCDDRVPEAAFGPATFAGRARLVGDRRHKRERSFVKRQNIDGRLGRHHDTAHVSPRPRGATANCSTGPVATAKTCAASSRANRDAPTSWQPDVHRRERHRCARRFATNPASGLVCVHADIPSADAIVAVVGLLDDETCLRDHRFEQPGEGAVLVLHVLLEFRPRPALVFRS